MRKREIVNDIFKLNRLSDFGAVWFQFFPTATKRELFKWRVENKSLKERQMPKNIFYFLGIHLSWQKIVSLELENIWISRASRSFKRQLKFIIDGLLLLMFDRFQLSIANFSFARREVGGAFTSSKFVIDWKHDFNDRSNYLFQFVFQLQKIADFFELFVLFLKFKTVTNAVHRLFQSSL